mgnify:FL=1
MWHTIALIVLFYILFSSLLAVWLYCRALSDEAEIEEYNKRS